MEKRIRKWLGILLSVIMTMSLIACGNTETPSAKDTKAPGSEKISDTTGGETKATETSVNTTDNGVDWEDMAEITILFPSLGPIPSGIPEVEAAVNEITEDKINTHVTINMIEVGSYAQQIGLLMSASEPVDLVLSLPGGPASLSAMKAQNQLKEITTLVDNYGKDIKSILGKKLDGTKMGDGLYGVTGNRTYVVSSYIIMRTDVLEDLGMLEKAQNMTTLSEYEEILAAVKNSEKWKNLAGMVSSDGQGTCLGIQPGYLGDDKFTDMTYYDTLGDTSYIVSISGDGENTTVEGHFQTEDYKKIYEKMNDWYQKGYIYKDVTTDSSMAEELVKNNVAFSYIGNCEAGVETLKSTDCGMPMTCVQMITYPVGTGALTKFVWTVPNSAKEPEAAVAFLNLMFTDSDLANLLAWGIEGRDYVNVNGEAAYPEGTTEAPYHTSDFLFGNQFITLPWQGDGADFREICEEIEKNATVSPYLGFAADTSSVTNEISALTNAIMEYQAQVGSGAASQTEYDAFMKKLTDSGIDKVVALYQEQLDTWLADK